MTIGVTGASGQLGQFVIGTLRDKTLASDIVGLVRSMGKSADLGVAAREFDYGKPETLAEALIGIEILLLISSSEVGQRVAQHHNVIEAAKKAGVKRIVYTSLLHAESSPLSLAGEHLQTESMLKGSGIPYAILRNGWYTENYTASIPGALASGAFLGSADAGRISSAARSDYAAAAATVVTSEGHDNKTYELAGDEAWMLSDLAAEVSLQSGKTIHYKNLPEADYAAALISFGLSEAAAKAYASFDSGAAVGALFDDGHQLSKLLNRPTTPLATVVADALR